MNAVSTNHAPRPRRSRWIVIAAGLLLSWAVTAYLLMPLWWRGYARRHPALTDIPNVAATGSGLPADPLNIAVIGTRRELMQAMVAAGWYPADPLSFESCLEIAEATVLKRAYDDAPVSSEFLFGRRQNLAFEQPVGQDPRERRHVRFWETDRNDPDGRPVWVGAAIFDRRVGFSHTTGQFTHHTDPNVDAERDYLLKGLAATGRVAEQYYFDGFHKTLSGKNGEGDPWTTDGRLAVAVIRPEPARQ
jgi:hypothetical protein